MSEHLFLYRIKDSDDRDCCAYVDAAGPKFECNHYFSSINICGSCYFGGEFPEYEEIETILTKDEYDLYDLVVWQPKNDENYREDYPDVMEIVY